MYYDTKFSIGSHILTRLCAKKYFQDYVRIQQWTTQKDKHENLFHRLLKDWAN